MYDNVDDDGYVANLTIAQSTVYKVRITDYHGNETWQVNTSIKGDDKQPLKKIVLLARF